MTNRHLPMTERIQRSSIKTPDGCWQWQLFLDRGGYGRMTANDKRQFAHRASYEAFVGPIPAGLPLDHLCRNRACVNPAHLEPVTQAENNRRSGRARTHCKNGHEFTEANTRISGGKRNCRACCRANSLAYSQRKKAMAQ